ncbi:ComF family protein [Aquisediminimonas sediminicola]|uniref:ComF family protein n=1 Tax=Alteraquisediminimonas sediminicola TaxID=2676787 RepID=UPI0031B81A6B
MQAGAIPQDQPMRMLRLTLSSLAGILLDFALPPRCIACGAIVADAGSLCADCWGQARFLTGAGCGQCGRPLPDNALVADQTYYCAPCLASPPAFDSVRAVMAYGDIARAVALQLKYGRQIAHARTISRLMARLVPISSSDKPAMLIPVPLHRWRLWRRGFNQSALVADHLARLSGLRHDRMALRRIRQTPSLGHLNRQQRHKAVTGAFRVAGDVQGRNIILIDDVFTTGSTAQACALALKKAGANRVDVICWARVCEDTGN